MKRYLWATGQSAAQLRPGTLLGGRYLVGQEQVVLDTQPGRPPESIDELPPSITAYLRLSTYPLQIPQVYGILRLEEAAIARSPQTSEPQILLLEHAPIYPEGAVDANGRAIEGVLTPSLVSEWQQGNALRQLNWLWQMVQLWQPLLSEGCAASLMTPALLRVDGALVRLLALQPDSGTPSLAMLGQFWQRSLVGTQPEIAAFVDQLCQQMVRGQFRNTEQLTIVLDQALAVVGQGYARQIQIATLTDQGPSRQRNEDACYPQSGTVLVTNTPLPLTPGGDTTPLVIVCDGIGGHEGGNVASELAISTVYHQLQPILPQATQLSASALVAYLEQAAFAANDVISQRNDSEKRHERQRMGTTLVTALVRGHQLYLTHVGDSRAYRITRTGCRQVTVDDDLATREVRLGYALYRNALQHPGSGSLVQALGMNASVNLHPTVQQFILDEDCLFLLCSDGLSDNDRVEQNWQTELLPILRGNVDLGLASRRLVELANRQNGHDNVTIGLVYCRVGDRVQSLPPLDPGLAAVPPPLPETQSAVTAPTGNPSRTVLPATQIAPPPAKRSPFRALLTLLSLLSGLGFAGIVAYALLRPQASPPVNSNPTPVSPTPTPSLSPTASPPSLAEFCRAQTLLSVNSPPVGNAEQGIVLPSRTPNRVLPGSILKVETCSNNQTLGQTLRLKVCYTPRSTADGSRTWQTGRTYPIEVPVIQPFVSVTELTALPAEIQKTVRESCVSAPPSPQPTGSPNG